MKNTGTNAMIKKIRREEYKRMLDEGRRFRNWSLYEPNQNRNPNKVYYIVVDDRGNSLLNKVETK